VLIPFADQKAIMAQLPGERKGAPFPALEFSGGWGRRDVPRPLFLQGEIGQRKAGGGGPGGPKGKALLIKEMEMKACRNRSITAAGPLRSVRLLAWLAEAQLAHQPFAGSPQSSSLLPSPSRPSRDASARLRAIS